jgi:flagellar basal-body rod modification protein FlgD
MTVTAITSATGPVLGAAENDYSEVGKIDFLNLLIAQIRNQDPLSPLDNAEFTTQITQFTMLEELTALKDKLEENLLIGQSINNTAMLALVGRDVTVAGDRVWVGDEGVSESGIVVEQPATATIEVVDEAGEVVATYSRELVAGHNDVTWDGKLAGGDESAEPGAYTLRVNVENEGRAVSHVTLMTGRVTGLRYENNYAVVEVGGEEFYVSEIYKVS